MQPVAGMQRAGGGTEVSAGRNARPGPGQGPPANPWEARTLYSDASGRVFPPDPPGPRVKVKTVESFVGPRLRHRVSPSRRLRSAIILILLAALIAGLLAGAFAVIGGGLALLVHHAAHGGVVQTNG